MADPPGLPSNISLRKHRKVGQICLGSRLFFFWQVTFRPRSAVRGFWLALASGSYRAGQQLIGGSINCQNQKSEWENGYEKSEIEEGKMRNKYLCMERYARMISRSCGSLIVRIIALQRSHTSHLPETFLYSRITTRGKALAKSFANSLYVKSCSPSWITLLSSQ